MDAKSNGSLGDDCRLWIWHFWCCEWIRDCECEKQGFQSYW